MHLFGKEVSQGPLFVAEVGVNHEGNIDAALSLVRLAAEAGADAVKFQTYTPERFVCRDRADALARVTRFGLSKEAHFRLKAEGEKAGIPVFSSAITDDVVPFLASLFSAIKIASGDIDFAPVIRAAARTGLTVIMSTGNATLEDVDRAVEWVRQEVGAASLADRLVLMQCTSAYPAPLEEAHVATIPLLAKRYGVPVGYSNHVIGPDACLAAVALGACLVEIHFTDEREGRTFRDHQLSMTRDELASLIAAARRVHAAVGRAGKEIQASERGHHLDIRKGIVAARNIPAGATLGLDDLSFARPATYFSSSQRDQLIGRCLKNALSAGALIDPANLN